MGGLRFVALVLGEQLLGPLASGFKGAVALHVRIEHFRGPAAAVDLVVMGEIGEPSDNDRRRLINSLASVKRRSKPERSR